MNADASLAILNKLLADASLSLEQLTVSQGLAICCAFYRNERAEGCSIDDDGDMLLYQWGMSAEEGSTAFTLDLTRQFILDEAEDENIWQLSLTFKFEPTEQTRAIGSGNQWCHRPKPRAVEHFENLVRKSAAFQAVDGVPPREIELDYFNAG